jgi:hypothetical protein
LFMNIHRTLINILKSLPEGQADKHKRTVDEYSDISKRISNELGTSEGVLTFFFSNVNHTADDYLIDQCIRRVNKAKGGVPFCSKAKAKRAIKREYRRFKQWREINLTCC